jgi:hypothetical protein
MGRPKLPGTKYSRNREWYRAYLKAYRAKNKEKVAAWRKKYRDNDEFRTVQRIKRKTWPSANPEYRRNRRAQGFNA